MNLLLIIIIIFAIIISLKLLKKLFKLAIFFFATVLILSSIFGYLIIKDFREMDDEKIIFLKYDEKTIEPADRYVIFLSNSTQNLSNSQIVKSYRNSEIEVVPESILFKIIKILR